MFYPPQDQIWERVLHQALYVQFEDEEKDGKAQEEAEECSMHWYDFWKHYVFWSRWAPVILTALLFIIGWAFYIWKRSFTVAYFEVRSPAKPYCSSPSSSCFQYMLLWILGIGDARLWLHGLSPDSKAFKGCTSQFLS